MPTTFVHYDIMQRSRFLELPAELRKLIYFHVFHNTIVPFHGKQNKWTPECLGLLLASKQTHQVALKVFRNTSVFELPFCREVSDGVRRRNPNHCVLRRLSKEIIHDIRHIRLDRSNTSCSSPASHQHRLAMFGNLRTLTMIHKEDVRPWFSMPWLTPLSHRGILKRVGSCTNWSRRHRFGLSPLVKIELEVFYRQEDTRMLITTDTRCETISSRRDVEWDYKQSAWRPARLWTQRELQGWINEEEVRRQELLKKLPLNERQNFDATDSETFKRLLLSRNTERWEAILSKCWRDAHCRDL